MATYSIVYKKERKYKAVIYSNSYLNPIQDIKKISLDLCCHINTEGILLFDLLLSNGENFNRFAEAYFNGKEIIVDTIRTIEMYDNKFLDEINSFYKGNYKLLNESVLTASERFKYAKQ